MEIAQSKKLGTQEKDSGFSSILRMERRTKIDIYKIEYFIRISRKFEDLNKKRCRVSIRMFKFSNDFLN